MILPITPYDEELWTLSALRATRPLNESAIETAWMLQDIWRLRDKQIAYRRAVQDYGCAPEQVKALVAAARETIEYLDGIDHAGITHAGAWRHSANLEHALRPFTEATEAQDGP